MKRKFFIISLIFSLFFFSYADLRAEETSVPVQEEEECSYWDFFLEIGQDMGLILQNSSHYLYFKLYPEKYGLDPETIEIEDGVARVTILIPGQQGDPTCYLSLAYYLHAKGVDNLFTISHTQTEEDPVPLLPLAEKVQEIAARVFKQGAERVEFTMIGHSLGTNIASKYIWRGESSFENVEVTKMISLAGRLRYVRNGFWWFCEDIREEIEETYQAIQDDPNRVTLYTMNGSKDGIIPAESVHIQDDPTKQAEVPVGHAGIIFCPEAHAQILEWLEISMNPTLQ